MSNELSQDLVVGLDAGGTRTRALLASAEDKGTLVLGEGAAGPGNVLTVPVPRLTDHLVEAVGRAVPAAARGRVMAVAGGFAGAMGTSPDEPGRRNALSALTAALARLGIAAQSVLVSSDIEAAFASAPGAPADGLALVAGTGAIAIRISGRRCTVTVDGDGWLLGDDGSGFWIGRSAVRAALRMADGRGRGTVLAGVIGRELGVPGEALPCGGGGGSVYGAGGGGSVYGTGGDGSPSGTRAVVQPEGVDRGDGPVTGGDRPPAQAPTEWSREQREAYRRHVLPAVMGEPPITLARFAPLVAEAARAGDAVAEEILREAADRLTETVRALGARPGERIVATGGLLGPDGPLTQLLDGRLRTLGLQMHWVPDGCRGAVALARIEYGRPARPTDAG
ncbi:N-acetylglucosamine kinase [Streptomyces sp. NPDC002845]